MFVRKFLAWAATASPAERAPAAASFARALLDGELPAEEAYEAEIALASLADDPSPVVRAAIATEIAQRADAPRQIVVALAADQSGISGPLLLHSPALDDPDLVEAAIIGDSQAQSSIARRSVVAAVVSAALIEIGSREAVIALLDNPGACVPAPALARAVERFGADAPVREALLARGDLTAALRARLVDSTSAALQDFVLSTGWMSAERFDRAAREAREKSYVIIARDAEEASVSADVTRHLREAGRLTAALLLRSLLSGERRLLACALAELTGVARDRVEGLVGAFDGAAFAALYRRAGLPEALLPVFRFALLALMDSGESDEFADGGLRRALVEQVIARCERADLSDAQPVLGLLRRLHAEAARQEAREFASWLARAQVMEAADSACRALDRSRAGDGEPSETIAGQSAHAAGTPDEGMAVAA